jgi:hypothetical protein
MAEKIALKVAVVARPDEVEFEEETNERDQDEDGEIIRTSTVFNPSPGIASITQTDRRAGSLRPTRARGPAPGPERAKPRRPYVLPFLLLLIALPVIWLSTAPKSSPPTAVDDSPKRPITALPSASLVSTAQSPVIQPDQAPVTPIVGVVPLRRPRPKQPLRLNPNL